MKNTARYRIGMWIIRFGMKIAGIELIYASRTFHNGANFQTNWFHICAEPDDNHFVA